MTRASYVKTMTNAEVLNLCVRKLGNLEDAEGFNELVKHLLSDVKRDLLMVAGKLEKEESQEAMRRISSYGGSLHPNDKYLADQVGRIARVVEEWWERRKEDRKSHDG